MIEETAAAPAPDVQVPQSAPVEPAALERKYRTIQEEKFFAKRDASSLPEPSIEAPPQEAEPTVSAQEALPPPDDFSAELPDLNTIPDDGVLLEGAVRHPDSPLPETAPQWQHDAYNRLQSDTSITDEDKKTIAALPPTAWDKARRWNADTKLLGQFRNEEVPISQVFDTLTKQSKERVAELETEAINRLLTSPEATVEFSNKHPQTFARVLSALITDHSDFISNVLKQKGFNVVKAEPFDKQKLLDELKNHPMYDTFADTDLADLVEERLSQLADMVGTNDVSPEELAQQLSQAEPETQGIAPHVQQVTSEIFAARDNQWLKAVGDGLQANGIKPATNEELRKNPAAAHLKTFIYNAALHGLPGVIANWDEHSAKWGESQPGFTETFSELTSYLQSGDVNKFRESSPALNPFYYEFGQKRANIAMIRNLYAAVDKMLSQQETVPTQGQSIPPQTVGTAPPTNGNRQYRTNSERRFFERLNGGGGS